MQDETRVIRRSGPDTRVVLSGAGAPVVVLHGWGGRIESMTPVIACLSAAFRTVAIDLPGFGETPAPPEEWGSRDYASHVRSLLAALDIGRAHFVGHSFGAKTALYLAAEHPDLVDKLVLVASAGLRSPPSLKARAKRTLSRAARPLSRLGRPGRAARSAIYRRIASEDYKQAGALRPILVRVVNEDVTELLPRLRASTLLIWGTRDDAVPLAHARRMEQLIPDAGLVLLEGAGHFCYLDEPDRFCRVVRQFFGAPLNP
jgi:pimeloyl-ACP methyl ester carboxylesterase